MGAARRVPAPGGRAGRRAHPRLRLRLPHRRDRAPRLPAAASRRTRHRGSSVAGVDARLGVPRLLARPALRLPAVQRPALPGRRLPRPGLLLLGCHAARLLRGDRGPDAAGGGGDRSLALRAGALVRGALAGGLHVRRLPHRPPAGRSPARGGECRGPLRELDRVRDLRRDDRPRHRDRRRGRPRRTRRSRVRRDPARPAPAGRPDRAGSGDQADHVHSRGRRHADAPAGLGARPWRDAAVAAAPGRGRRGSDVRHVRGGLGAVGRVLQRAGEGRPRRAADQRDVPGRQ